MKTILFALALLPQLAFAGTIVLTLTAEQGLSKLKLPGEITFESTNVFCEERGLTPMPWSAPRKQKVTPKIVSLSGNTVVLEITTDPKKQDICKYRFADYTAWSDDGMYYFSIDSLDKKSLAAQDAADLELTAHQNSLYTIECVAKKQYARACATFRDGIKKGYSSGNGARFTVDVKKVDKQKEVRANLEYRTRSERE